MIKLIIDSNVVTSETIEFKSEEKCLAKAKRVKEEYVKDFPKKDIKLIEQLGAFQYDFKQELINELKIIALGTDEPFLKVTFEKRTTTS